VKLRRRLFQRDVRRAFQVRGRECSVINDLLRVVLSGCRGGLLGFRRWNRLLLYLRVLGQEDLPLTEGPGISLL
jgi:hypothetical protein